MQNKPKKGLSSIDKKEFELPETTFGRAIEDRVFQDIIVQSLSVIPDIALMDGSFLDNLLGRSDTVKGIYTKQDEKNHSLSVTLEVRVAYGISLPEKAEEIQAKIVQDLTQFTGLHIASVEVVFKRLIPPSKKIAEEEEKPRTRERDMQTKKKYESNYPPSL